MDAKPTLKELSAITNVSMATISRALKNPDKVKYATKKKIEKAIEEYKNQNTKQSSGVIGLVVPDIANQFFPMMLNEIDSIATSNGMTIMICTSNGSTKKEDDILKKLIDIGVDGIIMIATDKATSFLSQIVKDKIIPIVFLDRDPGLNNITLVTTDNFSGSYQATKYLITLGHKRILYIGGIIGSSTEIERFEGYKSALADNDIAIREELIIHADFNFSKSLQMVDNLIKDKNLDCTAIYAANDAMALGAINALKNNKMQIPDNMSIIGYDGTVDAQYSGLTSVKQPFAEMGASAIFQLLSLIKNPYMLPKKVILPSSIVFRDSCKISL